MKDKIFSLPGFVLKLGHDHLQYNLQNYVTSQIILLISIMILMVETRTPNPDISQGEKNLMQ